MAADNRNRLNVCPPPETAYCVTECEGTSDEMQMGNCSPRTECSQEDRSSSPQCEISSVYSQYEVTVRPRTSRHRNYRPTHSGYGNRSTHSGYGSRSPHSGYGNRSTPSGHGNRSTPTGYGSRFKDLGYGSKSPNIGYDNKSNHLDYRRRPSNSLSEYGHRTSISEYRAKSSISQHRGRTSLSPFDPRDPESPYPTDPDEGEEDLFRLSARDRALYYDCWDISDSDSDAEDCVSIRSMSQMSRASSVFGRTDSVYGRSISMYDHAGPSGLDRATPLTEGGGLQRLQQRPRFRSRLDSSINSYPYDSGPFIAPSDVDLEENVFVKMASNEKDMRKYKTEVVRNLLSNFSLNDTIKKYRHMDSRPYRFKPGNFSIDW
jgi:hypothetical protein